MAMTVHTASCHCGAVKITAELDLAAGTVRCNCSSCAKARWWEVIVKPDAVHAIHGESETWSYRFGAKRIEMVHCRTCGIRLFVRGSMDVLGGAFVGINVACLDGASDEELAATPIHYANGRENDWLNVPRVTAHL